jgi:hypothetical protein
MTDTHTDSDVEPDTAFTPEDASLVQRVALAVISMLEGTGDGRHMINVAALLTASVAHSSGTPIKTTNAVHNITAKNIYAAMVEHTPAAPATTPTPAPAPEETPAT